MDALTDYISLFIPTYMACYTAPLKKTVTALLEYLDLDCSIRVSPVREAFSKGGSMEPCEPSPESDPGSATNVML